MVSNKKKSRARGEDKQKQFQEILKVGKELLIKNGTVGMRALARRLGMSEANLYNYVESKRELWIAIRIKANTEYQEVLKTLEDKKMDSFLEFCMEWASLFFDFVAEDYHRFRIMQFLSAPPLPVNKKTKKKKEEGPFEKKYRPFRFIEQGVEIIARKATEFKVKLDNPVLIYYYVYAVALGAAKAEADLRLSQLAIKKKTAEMIYEPILWNSDKISPEMFRSYVLKEIEEKIKKEIKIA